MKVGDLVRVTTQCDASGMWHRVGVVLAVGTYCKQPMVPTDDGVRADVMLESGRHMRFSTYALELVQTPSSQ
jgi:hypothetical protein